MLFLFAFALPALAGNYLHSPAISPDRKEIVFVSGGDVWRVDAEGGDATLLVAHPATESRPQYSPDGKRLAFVSDRTGAGDLYILTFATGELKRITFSDAPEVLNGWSRDGEWLYFHSTEGEAAGMHDVFRVRGTGGTPMPVAADRYTNEFFAAASPDGKLLALNVRGIAVSQWWRRGHSHIDLSEIHLLRIGATPSYERMTDGGAKELWPMWSPDGKFLYFVSDRTGVENLWRQPVGGTSRQISAFKDGRVLWPSISSDGKLIVFERDFGIWKIDTSNGKTSAIAVNLRGAPAAPGVEHRRMDGDFRDLALSPDGKKLAFRVRGEVFAADATEGGEAIRISRTAHFEHQVAWARDSRKIVYVSDRNGPHQVYLYDFEKREERQLTFSQSADGGPKFSPDGKSVAYTRGGTGIWVYDLESKQERQVAAADVGRQPNASASQYSWSPDNKWIAFAAGGAKGLTNIQVAPAAGGAAQPVSFLGNSRTSEVEWSPAGDFLVFVTGQRTETPHVARVDLKPAAPEFPERKFWELFAEPSKPGTKPVEIVTEQIRRRLEILDLKLAVDEISSIRISPDGKSLLITAEAGGASNLFLYSFETKTSRQLTATKGKKEDAQFSSDGKRIYYLDDGKVYSTVLSPTAPALVAVTAELDVDFEAERNEVFQQVWGYENDNFFDEKFNGADWPALRKQYQPYVARIRTPEELYRLLSLMLGELNASHLGLAKRAPPLKSTGRLGLRFDPEMYESNGVFRVIEVLPQGPAALAGLKDGDVVTAIDGVKLERASNLDEMLQHKAGKLVELTAGDRQIACKPIDFSAEKELVYAAWVDSRREYVQKASGGRLGYLHMRDMGAAALGRLYLDLDSSNHGREGVILDLRANTGGFVNAYALDVFARRPYLTFQPRGRAAAPARTVLGQRALELPTVLVTNQHSLSDAEDFTEGYRRLKLGKVIGEPTAGWIVYTQNLELIDGSTLRIPEVKVFDSDGVLMEMHPRPVDVPVQRPMGESYRGNDVQLETAVRELLQQIDSSRARPAAASGLQ